MPIEERFKEVQRLRLCLNCLRNDHFTKTCRMESCKECTGRHNTLLHRPVRNKESTEEKGNIETSVSKASSHSNNNVTVHHISEGPKKQYILMATAIVDTIRSNGTNATIRILLDSASEANFITQAACNKLGIKRNRTSEIVTGLNAMESQICQSCDIVIKSRQSNYQMNAHCLVVPTVTKQLPSVEIDRNAVEIPGNLKFADAGFYKPGSIDMLIGAEYFFDLLETKKIEGVKRPVLLNTKFGWIIARSIPLVHISKSTGNHNTLTTVTCSIEHCDTLTKTLQSFWEIKNVQSEMDRTLSIDEQQCDDYFDKTTTRDASGRFIVRLPFRGNPSQLGESRDRRLMQLERRFKKDKILHDRYVRFMRCRRTKVNFRELRFSPEWARHRDPSN